MIELNPDGWQNQKSSLTIPGSLDSPDCWGLWKVLMRTKPFQIIVS